MSHIEPHDDFQGPEPVEGLPERPPEGERILWQGRPDWWALAVESMWLKWVAIYFGFLALWRGLAAGATIDAYTGVKAAIILIVMGAIACALILLIAFVQARAAMYTITNRRVVMRVGAALTVTLNLPYRWIGSADLDLRRGGTGTIALDLIGETRFSYLVLWPHVRPWRMKKAHPALRCIKDAEDVADILAAHARAAVTQTTTGFAPDPAQIAAE